MKSIGGLKWQQIHQKEMDIVMVLVRKRSQTYNPVTEQWVKRDTETGRFMDVKQDGAHSKECARSAKLRGRSSLNVLVLAPVIRRMGM